MLDSSGSGTPGFLLVENCALLTNQQRGWYLLQVWCLCKHVCPVSPSYKMCNHGNREVIMLITLLSLKALEAVIVTVSRPPVIVNDSGWWLFLFQWLIRCGYANSYHINIYKKCLSCYFPHHTASVSFFHHRTTTKRKIRDEHKHWLKHEQKQNINT